MKVTALLSAATLAYAAGTLAPSTQITNVIAFGDSLSDNGSGLFAHYGMPVAPYWDGHFSSGKVWVEYLSSFLKAELTDFAYGGAVANSSDSFGAYAWYNSTLQVSQLPDLQQQIATYKAGASVPAASTLFSVFIGSNDVMDQIKGGATPSVGQVAYTITAIETLLASGAQNIMVTGLPPLWLVPELNSASAAIKGEVQMFVTYYNQYLQSGLAKMQAAVPSANLIYNDWTPLLTAISSNATAYDYTDVTDACYEINNNATVASACATPESYFFFDHIHPATRGHNYLAQASYNTIFNISGFSAPANVVNPPNATTTTVAYGASTATVAAATTGYVAPPPTYAAPAAQTGLYSSAVGVASSFAAMVLGFALL